MIPVWVIGLFIGLCGLVWFAWHLARPLPTGPYWPGLWFRQSARSIISLRVFAAGGLLEAAGIIGMTFYPQLDLFAAGGVLFFVGAVMQISATLFGAHKGAILSRPGSRLSSSVGVDRARLNWPIITALVIIYIAVMVGAAWAIEQMLPPLSGPPPGGYAQTTGIVEATYPNDHDQVRYSFQVANRTYEAIWFADGAAGNATALRVGQTITIWYEVADPSKSCDCVDPQELQRTNNNPTPVVLFVLALVSGAAVLVAGRMIFGDWLAIIQWTQAFTSTGVLSATRKTRGGDP